MSSGIMYVEIEYPMRKPRLTSEQKTEILKRYKAGESMAELAKAFNCSSSTICYTVNPKSKAKNRAANERWKQDNPERYKAAKDRWYQECKDDLAFKQERSSYAADYYLHNKEKVSSRNSKWYQENREMAREKLRRCYRNNPHAAARNCAKRRAAKLQATPPWLTAEHWQEIEAVYELAAELTVATGVKHEVDHVHPLRGRTVCGLHVPWNLEAKPLAENRKKSNKL